MFFEIAAAVVVDVATSVSDMADVIVVNADFAVVVFDIDAGECFC